MSTIQPGQELIFYQGTPYYWIVSTYNRPQHLRCCLASIQIQEDQDWKCMVMDEGHNKEIVDQLQDGRFIYKKVKRKWVCTRGTLGLWPKDVGADRVEDEAYCIFPSEDTYYLPQFLAAVKHVETLSHADIILTDFLHELNNYQAIIEGAPVIGKVDVASFAIRNSIFKRFRFRREIDNPVVLGVLDGKIVRDAVAAGCTFQRIHHALVVHT